MSSEMLVPNDWMVQIVATAKAAARRQDWKEIKTETTTVKRRRGRGHKQIAARRFYVVFGGCTESFLLSKKGVILCMSGEKTHAPIKLAEFTPRSQLTLLNALQNL